MTVSPAASTTTALPMFGDHLKPHLFWATYRFPDGSNATWEAERRCFENTKSLPFLGVLLSSNSCSPTTAREKAGREEKGGQRESGSKEQRKEGEKEGG